MHAVAGAWVHGMQHSTQNPDPAARPAKTEQADALARACAGPVRACAAIASGVRARLAAAAAGPLAAAAADRSSRWTPVARSPLSKSAHAAASAAAAYTAWLRSYGLGPKTSKGAVFVPRLK